MPRQNLYFAGCLLGVYQRWRIAFVLLLAMVGGKLASAAPPAANRFSALLEDGTRIEGAQLQEWHTVTSKPKLDGKPLLDDKTPFRWLRDRSLPPPAMPKSFVELHGGDRLPGSVIGYEPAVANDYRVSLACFVVEPVGLLAEPRDPNKTRSYYRKKTSSGSPIQELRVFERCVRRIVWQSRGASKYEPGMLFLRDGRALSFRVARFSDAGIAVLQENGQQQVSFGDVAEIHFPAVDAWTAHLTELAALSPDLKSRLLQVESTAGVIVTASLSRFASRAEGGDKDFDRWIHGFQPAWSPDVLWLAARELWMRRSFSPLELPLSRLPAAKESQASLLAGSGWPGQCNRNALGDPLQTAQHDFGWGLGTHARHEATFVLPACAVSFHSHVGIDRAARGGGCIKAKAVLGDSSAAPFWASGFLTGSQPAVDTGVLSLPRDGAQPRTLTLEIDPAHAGRPAGADPFDIRDLANWLDPVLVLDALSLQTELAPHAGWQAAALAGWTLNAGDDPQWHSAWDDALRQPDRFMSAVRLDKSPLRWEREITLNARDEWLVVLADRLTESGNGPRMEVRVEGELATRQFVPARHKQENLPKPVVVSLAPYKRGASTKVLVEITLVPGSAPADVFWHAICLKPQPPALFAVLDEPSPQVVLREGARFVATDRHTGEYSMQFAAGELPVDLRFPATLPIRERPVWGEYRYVQFAVRKTGGGRFGVEWQHADSLSRPARYDLGKGAAVQEKSKRAWDVDLPKEWIVITRDLYQDFGEIEITGLAALAPDGEQVWLDRVYFGRTEKDFEAILAALPPAATNQAAVGEIANRLKNETAPRCVTLDFGDNRLAAGALLTNDGLVLTLARAAAAPGRAVTAIMPNGDKLSGKTLGLHRELDLALVQLQHAANLSFFQIAPAGEFHSGGEMRFALTATPPDGKHDLPQLVDVREDLHNAFWAVWQPEKILAGSPLIDVQGRLVGLLRGKADGGRSVFAKTNIVHEHLAALKAGGVLEKWSRSTAPDLGLGLVEHPGGGRVARFSPGSAAEQAGVKLGDVVLLIDGKPATNTYHVERILTERLPFDEIAISVRRNGQPLELKARLQPRVP